MINKYEAYWVMKRPSANKRVAAWLRGYIERGLSEALSEAEIPARVMVKVLPSRMVPDTAHNYLHLAESDYLAMIRCPPHIRNRDLAVNCSLAGPWRRNWDYSMAMGIKGPFNLKRQANKLIEKFITDFPAGLMRK